MRKADRNPMPDCCDVSREINSRGTQQKITFVGNKPSKFNDRMIRIEGGQILIGTDRPIIDTDGEGVLRHLRIRPFAIDPQAVTSALFSDFISSTGYITDAERFGWSFVFRKLLPLNHPQTQAVQGISWWRKVHGASWRRPEGAGSNLEGRENHPVVHVSWDDAQAFASWAGARLPTEAEWEHAARGGLHHPRYPWGDREPDEAGFLPCNIWQGEFPEVNTRADGFLGTAPADSFQPNGYGLYNMVGNVWEWCFDAFRIHSLKKTFRERNERAARDGARVLKGGSYLCHASYCWRYRIAARIGNPKDTTTGHIGFRLAADLP